MIFIWILIISSHSIIFVESIFLQQNVIVELNFECFENSNFIDTCSQSKGYSNCYLIFKLCVKSHPKSKNTEDTGCDLLKKTYNVTNTKGMCKRGKMDTRKILKDVQKFHAKINKIHIYIKIYVDTILENSLKEDSEFYYEFNESKGTHLKIPIINRDLKVKSDIKILMNFKVGCLLNFQGEQCEKFCISQQNDFNCSLDRKDICTKDWINENCNKSTLIDIAKECQCKHTMDPNNNKCSQKFETCLEYLLKCQQNLTNNLKSCSESLQNLKTPLGFYFQTSTIATMVVISGLIFIIFTLLISLLFIWKKKSQILRSTNPSISSYNFMRRSSQRPLPNPFEYLDVPESNYMTPRSDTNSTFTGSSLSPIRN